VIEQLKKTGDIAADDLAHIERIARHWVRISQENLAKGRCSRR
jgi:hypothetical protein